MENSRAKASSVCRRLCAGVAAALLAVAPAFGEDTTVAPPGPPAETLYPLPEIEGAVPWQWLADVQMEYEGIDLVPRYRPELRALDGETVTLVGFPIPLSADGRRLLLSMISPSCPFCLPGGPETFIELLADDPIAFTDEAAVVTGRLELLEDSLSGYFYRLHGARRLPDPAA